MKRIKVKRYSFRLALATLFAANLAQAGPRDLYNWRCPYTPDGACPPNRVEYGHYRAKWSRWPGVSDADYQSRLKPGELSTPVGPRETPPRETPENLILPPDPGFDEAPPPPPSNDPGVPPLTPESELRPDILTPPGEEAMEELLPNGQPSRQESVPRGEDSLTPELTPESNPQSPAEETPKGDKPFEGDPFKDDLFDESPPAPPSESKDRGSNMRLRERARNMPATHTVPSRIRATSDARESSPLPRSATMPKSRLIPTTVPEGKSAIPAMHRPARKLTAAPRSPHNPLREIPAFEETTDDFQAMPVAAWEEANTDQTSPTLRANPLRR